MHDLITNDWFIFITGLCSVFGLLVSLFVASKVIKIDNSNKIGTQNITTNGNGNQTAGKDILDKKQNITTNGDGNKTGNMDNV